MKVLIACEESQAITIEMRKLGIEAYSCDIQECSGGYPEWHIQGDAIEEAYSGKYDMMIAHPPCTYLSNAGACHLFRGGELNQERYKKGIDEKYNNPDNVYNLREESYAEVVKTCNDVFGEKK